MIPLHDDNPTRTKPYLVYALLAINIGAYLVDVVGGGTLGNLWNLSMVPKSIMTGEPVMVVVGRDQQGQLLGALHTGLTPQWLTIFTSMFMHGGLMHIGGNMLYLWIFGNNIEDTLGHVKFIIFYLVCGFVAALAHIGFNPGSTVPLVGASGAIAGVLGAYIVLFPHSRIRTLVFLGFFITSWAVPAVVVLGIWFFTQLINLGGSGGLQGGGGVAYAAHVGGFIAGAILILLLGGKSMVKPPKYELYDYRGRHIR